MGAGPPFNFDKGISMKFIESPLNGAFVIEPEKKGDQRGFFSRLFCSDLFREHGIESQFVQVNHSKSHIKGTLRGLHYQLPPKEEDKIVRCIHGAIFDVIVDLRPGSETFGEPFTAHLSQENGLMMVVPKGFAHGFYSLEPDTEIIYWVSESYAPKLERGIRWDDPFLNIKWPGQPKVISDKDAGHENFDPMMHKEAYATLV